MKIFRNDFFIALCFLAAYLITNSYVYGWDDQHLEIPTLKHLIDPSLYKGDYYVESLSRNFTSYLYPVLAKFIRVNQIPAAYLILFLLARYAMFFWVFRLWELISGSRFAAFAATAAFFLLGRTEEFLYRTFSHQELSYVFMFPGIYYFYRERYVLAAFILGLGANIHAIYNLFPMLYMLAFLVLFHPKRWSMVIKTGLTFTLAALPFLLWQIPRSIADKVSGTPPPMSEWIPLYLLSCPQNFLFQETPLATVLNDWRLLFEKLMPYIFLTSLYIFHVVFNPLVRRDKKLHALVGVSWLLIVVSYYFHYVHPSRFILDLNLVRVEQFVRFWLMGYTFIWAAKQVQEQKIWVALSAVLLCITAGALDIAGLWGVSVVSIVMLFQWYLSSPQGKQKTIVFLTAIFAVGAMAYAMTMNLKTNAYVPLLWDKFKYVFLGMGLISLGWVWLKAYQRYLRPLLLILPIAAMFISFCFYHYNYLQMRAHGGGFWQMQRNWEDMQNYAREHTPKDAFILTPYDTDMGGFRIRSERKVLVCTRDCGIIGFDYGAAVEWHKRIQDIEAFRMITHEPIDKALLTAILKYRVDYVVFMNYYEPKSDNPILKKMYQNEVFALYQVVLKAS